jgi:hypothetical protein
MTLVRTRLYGKVAENSSGSGGGSSAGAANAVQKGDGAGAFVDTGWTSPADHKLRTVDTKVRFEMFPIGQHSGVTSGSDIVVAAADIADGEAVSIFAIWSGKRDSNNTGVGGTYHATWTKAGGVLNIVGELEVTNVNDTGTNINASTVDSGGSIALQIAEVAAVFNFSYSGFVFIVYRKAA